MLREVMYKNSNGSRKNKNGFVLACIGFILGVGAMGMLIVIFPESFRYIKKLTDTISTVIAVDKEPPKSSVPGSLENNKQKPEIQSSTGGEIAAKAELAKESGKVDVGAQPQQDEEESLLLKSERLVAAIDQISKKEYFLEAGVEQSGQSYFASLVQKMIDNQPVVLRESDDLLTLLKNIAHFFRIFGKTSVELCSTILKEERESIEDIAADAFAVSMEPAEFSRVFCIHLDEAVAYQYATFFLQTLGGRTYLFRRFPEQRLVFQYYCLLIVDNANTTKSNTNGVDIRQPLESLILELEQSGSLLKKKEKYLARLYEIKNRYKQPVSSSEEN